MRLEEETTRRGVSIAHLMRCAIETYLSNARNEVTEAAEDLGANKRGQGRKGGSRAPGPRQSSHHALAGANLAASLA